MVSDARRRGCTPFFDFGFLAYITLPLSLPWYLVRTRGWLRGLLVLLFVVALWLAPRIIAMIAWKVLYGEFAGG
jgi:hypothetical protein